MQANYSNSNAILGNSVDVNLCNIEDAEIRADVVVKQVKAKRVWGQVVDCNGTPMPNMLVKLVKVLYTGDTVSYQGVAHTIADCQGFYQFDICSDDKSCYKILVNKSVTGGETVINTRGENCNPCKPPHPGCREAAQDTCAGNSPVTVIPYKANGCEKDNHGYNDHHLSESCPTYQSYYYGKNHEGKQEECKCNQPNKPPYYTY